MATPEVSVTPTATPTPAKAERKPDPCVVVIFGASGDLTKRKLLPALYHLDQSGLLPEDFAVVGVARRDLSATFGPDMKDGILKGGGVEASDPKLDPFMQRVQYFATNFDDDEGFEKLKAYLVELDGKFMGHQRQPPVLPRHVAPEFFADIINAPRQARHEQAPAEGGITGSASSSKSPLAPTSPAPASSTTTSTRSSPKTRSSASTTTSARRRSRTSSSSASPTASSSPSGIATTSTTSRSPLPNRSASKAAGRSTSRPAHSATCSRTTSWKSSPS